MDGMIKKHCEMSMVIGVVATCRLAWSGIFRLRDDGDITKTNYNSSILEFSSQTKLSTHFFILYFKFGIINLKSFINYNRYSFK